MADLIYHSGIMISEKLPLARYLPRLPQKATVTWLENNIPKGSWVIDPFGASPQLAIEIAQAGYRLMVAVNNPIGRFLLEMAASPPKNNEMLAALAELAATRRGEERLEPHILALYETQCDLCGKTISADAFLWEKEAKLPYARIYTCPHCQHSGEFPVTNSDIEKAAKFSDSSPHHFRALQRVVKSDHPDAVHVKNALDAYLPRAVYALFSILNKLDGLTITERQKQLLIAMILCACDKGNALWKEPIANERPKQLAIPPLFRENNIWRAIEESIPSWTENTKKTELCCWPELPPEDGGICLFEGRFANLADQLNDVVFQAVVTAFPRPNQAFWTLSALWSGWLWGRESIGPFVSVLRHSRFDWAWHTAALVSSMKVLSPVLKPGTKFFGLVTESEPSFDASVMIAADIAGFVLDGQALRPPKGQSQFQWHVGKSNAITQNKKEIIQEAAQSCLISRGEASQYYFLQAAALESLGKQSSSQNSEKSPAEIYTEINSILGHDLTFRQGFLRYNAGSDSMNIGHWWLREDNLAEEPLSDRLEKRLINYLLANPNQSFLQLDQRMCDNFPGLNTPDLKLIRAILISYAIENDKKEWVLKKGDRPSARRTDLDEIKQALISLGHQLGYVVIDETPMVWQAEKSEENYYIYIIASAVIGEFVYQKTHPPEQGIIVLPGSRAELLTHKRHRDPRLQHTLEQGWHFLKFRQVRQISENKLLTRENLRLYFEEDPLEEVDPQFKMF